MKHQFSQTTFTTCFTLCLFSIAQAPVHAAPGSLGQIPLFVAPPTQPNIFFMMDDSGSMGWNLRLTGAPSISFSDYQIDPNHSDTNQNQLRWRAWCLGANALGYNPAIKYKPWAANMPGTSDPYPDQTDITDVWSEPTTKGVGSISSATRVRNRDQGSVNLSDAPVVQWTDDDNDGLYDEGECAYSYSDNRVKKASTLSATERTNFANWFTYYRDRDRTVTAAVTQVISTSSARMGVGTLNGGSGVGMKIEDMTVLANKDALLAEVARIRPSGGTPLQASLNRVGQYFDQNSTTPSALNISTADSDKPILPIAKGGECQQNFAMLMTDGYGWGSAGVGHQDQDIDNEFVYPAHKDNRSNQLADVAMKWFSTDLAPGLDNKVPVQSGDNTQNLDENDEQHLVTFTIAFGLSDSLSDPVDRTQTFNWPTGSLADMRHAAYNGRGKYLSAGNPESLISSLQEVISDIESRHGSAAAVSFNSTSLMENSSLFSVSFNTTGWTGDVRAFKVNASTGELNSNPQWSAAPLLDSRTNLEILDRVIYSWGLDSAGNNNGVLFKWTNEDPQLAANILSDFKINPDSSTDSTPFTESQARLNYVRGNTSKDGTGLIRKRDSRLADIIHSAPRYVGAPASNWPDTDSFGTEDDKYSSYQAGLQSRAGVVYVGANDGLLHGFKTSDGEEVLAYLPGSLASSVDNTGLHYLSESDYQHRYYVDGSPVSADVYISTEAAGSNAWRTILVGALGGGGQGLYALDVTDPDDFNNTDDDAKKTVLWEFTSQDDADLGFSFSEPQIAKMNNGEWAVIIGNGYNATGTDTAQLIILYIRKGIDGTWSAGDYKKLDTATGTAVNKNGLSAPALIDLDNNGTTDRVYAGDLLGNLWAFDVSDSSESNWGVAHQNSANTSVPLFTAKHHAGSPSALVSVKSQPITMKPLLVKPDADWLDDDASNTPNVMVYFGTGQYIATGDATNTDKQTFYGVWDAGVQVAATQLIEQTFIEGVPVDDRVLTSNSVTFPLPPESPSTTSESGWFINLPEAGERVVVDAFVYRGLVFFNTMTPSSKPCSAGGESWKMAVDMKTGGNPTIGAFDKNDDGEFDDLDKVSDGSDDYHVASMKFTMGIASATVVMKNKDGKAFGYTSGTRGTSDSSNVDPALLPPVGSSGIRHSWIQLFN